MFPNKSKLTKIAWGLIIVVAAVRLLVPKPELAEKYTYSTAVFDRNGELLNLGLTMDDKYRLRVSYEQVPPDAVKALLLYEDRYFFRHFGINPLSVVKAMILMLAGGRRQGASTITMQVARMVFRIDSSTIIGKLEQMLRAIQIEMFYSKREILEAYFNLAPYGGNVEGIGAAALIYFQKTAENLNKDQVVTLTVVPQHPSKRNLGSEAGQKEAELAYRRLADIWRQEYGGDITDRLPKICRQRPFAAPHLVRRLKKMYSGVITSSLDLNYQNLLEKTITEYLEYVEKYGVNNAAAMIVDHRDMRVLAKVGSADFFSAKIFGQVDGTGAYRSPGSVMKPFIYAMALDQGLIHPRSMLKDVPRNFGNYMPENYDRSFYGMIDATSALVKSRNVPAVELLLKIGAEKYYQTLEECGVRFLKNFDYYGLALALGGYELTMENIAEMYATLANGGRFQKLRFTENEPASADPAKEIFSPEAAFLVVDMLRQNPPVDRDFYSYTVDREDYDISWKTGTSFGYRDAWTAGIAGRYVVVVWLGNFDGTSNAALVGQKIAAPLFFKIIRQLAKNTEIGEKKVFPATLNLAKVNICEPTGDIADADCSKKVYSYFIPGVTQIKVSDISRRIPIDLKTGKRACRHRPPFTVMKSYEFWPSDVLAAYRAAGIAVRRPPDFGEDCELAETAYRGRPPQILFPAEDSVLVKDTERTKILLKASADADAKEIFWFLNGKLIGSVPVGENFQTELESETGEMMIKAVDDRGRSNDVKITIVPVLGG